MRRGMKRYENVFDIFCNVIACRLFVQYLFVDRIMSLEANVVDTGSSSCTISIMLTFNAVLNLCFPLSFLWICFQRLKLKLSYPGTLWIFVPLGSSILMCSATAS